MFGSRVFFIPYTTGHTGVGTLLGSKFYGSPRMMEYQVLLAECLSLDLVEFHECFVVVS